MANKNFVVQNGLTVGGLTIDATSGNITTTGVFTTTNSDHPAEFQGNLSVGGTLTVGGVAVNGSAGLTVDSDFTANAGAFTTIDIPTRITSDETESDKGTISVGGPQSFSDYGLIGSFVANTPTYSYVSVQNINNGGNASASFAAYNDIAAFIDLGINSSTFNASESGFVNSSVNQPNASYVYAQGGDMVLGTWSDHGIHFITKAETNIGDSMFISGNGNVYISGNLTVTGNTSVTNSVTNFTTQTANIIQVAYLSGNSSINGGAITVTGNILPSANLTYNLGSSTAWYSTFYGVSTQAKYADLAENYQGDSNYQPGQVLMFGGTKEVTLATADTKAVAGVVSTNPAHLMNGALTGTGVIAVALQGRVPCNVVGPIVKGDLLVSAGFGYAKANNNAQVGQVIGKALADFTGAKGQIEVVVGRV